MENAADALKIVLAIFIFAIGIVLLFNMASQAKETARIMIAETDRTKYYEYFADAEETRIDANGNRIVELQDIIPALYRYATENYGVTIINKSGEVVARFDSDTERICNDWRKLNETNSGKERKKQFIVETRYTYIKANRLAKLINNKDNTIKFYQEIRNVPIKQDGTINYEEIDLEMINETEMENLFKKLYAQQTSNLINLPYYCWWIGKNGWTSQRIDSDLSRNRSTI